MRYQGRTHQYKQSIPENWEKIRKQSAMMCTKLLWNDPGIGVEGSTGTLRMTKVKLKLSKVLENTSSTGY
jgi:hypothetical protein